MPAYIRPDCNNKKKKMINSKSLDDLLPHVAILARQLIEIAEEELDIDELRVTSTYRDYEYQNWLYAQGRTRPGQRVTSARGGYSWHNFQVAFDVVPMRDGKAIWDNVKPENKALWHAIGDIGKELGLEWGGDWQMVDMPHFQDAGGLSMAQLRARKAD